MIRRVPFRFKEEIEAGIFKHNLGIRQFTVNGFYIEGIPLDLEYKFHIQGKWLEIRRNGFTIYNEKLINVLFATASDVDEEVSSGESIKARNEYPG